MFLESRLVFKFDPGGGKKKFFTACSRHAAGYRDSLSDTAQETVTIVFKFAHS